MLPAIQTSCPPLPPSPSANFTTSRKEPPVPSTAAEVLDSEVADLVAGMPDIGDGAADASSLLMVATSQQQQTFRRSISDTSNPTVSVKARARQGLPFRQSMVESSTAAPLQVF